MTVAEHIVIPSGPGRFLLSRLFLESVGPRGIRFPTLALLLALKTATIPWPTFRYEF